MKRAVVIIGFLTLFSLFAILPSQQTAAPTPKLPTPEQLAEAATIPTIEPTTEGRHETRALWVVRHTITSPDAIRDLVRRAKTNGFTDLVVQVRGRGDAYYNSRIEPRAEDLSTQPNNFDPLAMVVDEAHSVGIKVHAWLNIYLVANVETLPQAKDHIIFKHPEWLMVPRGVAGELYGLDPKSTEYLRRIVQFTRSYRTDLEGLFVTPANREVQENVFNIWMDVATKYAGDALHFDYVRYPNPQFDYSRASINRFREDIEQSLSRKERDVLASVFRKDPLIYVTKYSERYAQFQRRQVTELVERIY